MALVHPPFRFVFLALAAFSIWSLFPILSHSTPPIHRIRDQVDTLLNAAIYDAILPLHSKDPLDILAINDLQYSLACYVHSGRSFSSSPLCSPAPRKSSSPALTLCSKLRTKKILLVGPESTFHLHSLWLHSLSQLFNTSSKCLGPEFCTFHHVCLDQAIEASLSNTRVKKFPSSRDLLTYGSSILRFILSTTLYASNNPRDLVYTTPIIDSQTGVRTKNSFWMNQARKTDILVLNRGPVPAPAWTYSFDLDPLAGNWSFVDDLYSNTSTRYFGLDKNGERLDLSRTYYHRYRRAIRIINAALHATLTIFLPGIMDTLTAIQKNDAIIVWHGTWYLNPICTNYGSPKGFSIEPQILPLYDDDSSITVDPWTLYYNAQGAQFSESWSRSDANNNNNYSVHARQAITQPSTAFWRSIFTTKLPPRAYQCIIQRDRGRSKEPV